jgi:uncharacterized protein (TIGR02453 family)
MQYFQQQFIDFFSGLSQNNSKEWFDTHRKEYEKYVKEPFKVFVADVIRELYALNPAFNLEPKDCIFRINRDIRFSVDKTPYKVQASAGISPGGKKEMAKPGIYIEFGATHARVYSGVYMPDKEQLNCIRTAIGDDLNRFRQCVNNPEFVKNFGQIRGDKNKIVPKEFKEIVAQEPLVANKQFYFFKEYATSKLLTLNFLKDIIKDYQVALPVMEFFEDALMTDD